MSVDAVTSTSTAFRPRRFAGAPLGWDRFYPWAIVVLLAYSTADLVIIKYRHLMLPTEAPPPRPQHVAAPNVIDSSLYKPILDKNIFAADGKIPPALVSKDQETTKGGEEIPIPSNLPLNLIGTLVHSNPEKSIATIEVKPKNTTIAIRVGKEIEGMAKLIKVERNRAIIRNLNNNRLEFIEMKSLSKLSFQTSKSVVPTVGSSVVRQPAPGKFEINRADVLKYTADMASLLQQAAMQPVHNSQGEIDGYRFIAIQPNSVFVQLGMQAGDVLRTVNGEKVDSPAKAMELYNALKNSPTIKVGMSRDGHDMEQEYNVK
ncbi:MAG: general secretion pathway protein GspC [Bdellovibrio sp.]|nr:MAG: general secretion pathway protein GspC [Bdellovibrio sp.]